MRFSPYYQKLGGEARILFEQRMFLLMLARKYETKGMDKVPEDLKGMVAAIGVQLTLGLEEYHLYDSSIPVVEIDENYEYADVKNDVIKSVKPLGKAYTKNLKEAFTPGWVDVYETPGKSTGAYSGGVYNVHPYML